MGVSSQPSFVRLSLRDLVEGTDEVGTMKVMNLESQKPVMIKKGVKSRRRERILMKRRACLMGSSRRRAYKIERRVTKLKRLIPNGGESMGLEGLFRKTADYILTLKMRVRVMQIMVKVLMPSDQ